jgi:hypothetical protein
LVVEAEVTLVVVGGAARDAAFDLGVWDALDEGNHGFARLTHFGCGLLYVVIATVEGSRCAVEVVYWLERVVAALRELAESLILQKELTIGREVTSECTQHSIAMGDGSTVSAAGFHARAKVTAAGRELSIHLGEFAEIAVAKSA